VRRALEACDLRSRLSGDVRDAVLHDEPVRPVRPGSIVTAVWLGLQAYELVWWREARAESRSMLASS
jgi:hypothetical protein